MKIKEIKMLNFRQFYDEVKFSFSINPNQGITVIHGENGAGKTSLLNAFKWCFYGQTDFDSGNDNILNEQAIVRASSGQDLELSVEVSFEHDSYDYTAKRSFRYTKTSGLNVDSIGGSIFNLSWIGPDGKYEKSNNSETQMNQILPSKMHSYFFFNGERIEKLANASSANQIRDAIKALMGLQTIERAGIHLDKHVIPNFKKEIKTNSPTHLQDIIEKENSLIEKIDDLTQRISTAKTNISIYKDEKKIITDRLSTIKEATELQKERDGIENRLIEINDSKKRLSDKIKSEISERGFLAFFGDTAELVGNLLEEKRKKGELPYKIKQQFIDDLLDRKICICGKKFVEGDEHYNSIESYRLSAGSKSVEEAFMTTTSSLKNIERNKKQLYEVIKDTERNRQSLEQERARLNGRLDTITSKLAECEIEEIQALEARRLKIENELDELLRKEGRMRGELEENLLLLEDVKKERESLVSQSQQHSLLARRLSAAEECSRVIRALHQALSDQTKENLSERVNKTFRDIIRKPYWAEIDDEYTLQIYKEIEGHGKQLVIEKSTAESQITSLSFIASIVNLAKEQQQKEGQLVKGGVFPIIMDSPFGALDPEYRALIAKYIPMLADQVILMASRSQWQGPVEEECASRVGKQVSLIYYSPNVDKNRENYYVRESSDYEYTQIEEGYHG